MKKIMIMMSFVLAMVLTSCSNTPSSVAEKIFDAVNDQNYEEAVQYVGDKNGDALTQEQQDNLVAMLKEKASKNTDKREDFEIINETISEDGNSATVEYTYKTGDTVKNDSMKLVKGKDGKWRQPMGK